MRKVPYRKAKYSARLAARSAAMLDHAQQLFDGAADLDTAVRDSVYEGLARIVYAAYDTKGCAECISDFDFAGYIEQRTYEWFRERGFVEWFCVGASTLFRNSPREFFRIRTAKAKSGKATVITKEKVG